MHSQNLTKIEQRKFYKMPFNKTFQKNERTFAEYGLVLHNQFEENLEKFIKAHFTQNAKPIKANWAVFADQRFFPTLLKIVII